MEKSIKSIQLNDNQYYELYISCPSCSVKGLNTCPKNFRHDDCDGDIYLGDNARLYCDKCQLDGHVLNFDFYCPIASDVEEDVKEHSTPDGHYRLIHDKSNQENKSEEDKNISSLVTIAGQLTTLAGLDWLIKYLSNLENNSDGMD